MWSPLEHLDGINRLIVKLEQEFLSCLRGKSGIDDLVASPTLADIFAFVDEHPHQAWLMTRIKSSHAMTPRHGINVMLAARSWAVWGHRLGDQLNNLALAALFHDLGHWRPDTLVYQFDWFSHEEMRNMRTHPILEPGDLPLEPQVLTWIAQHHEQPDGRGYPKGISNPEPLAGLIRVVDCLEGMTTPRRFRPSFSPAGAMTVMARWAGGKFNRGLYKSYRKFLGEYPIGSFMRLKSGPIAVSLPGYPQINGLVLTDEDGDPLDKPRLECFANEEIEGEGRHWHETRLPDEWRALRPDLMGLPRYYEN